MHLAKPLKSNPRALGEQLKGALEGAPAFQQWVEAIELAGPGLLKPPLKDCTKQHGGGPWTLGPPPTPLRPGAGEG